MNTYFTVWHYGAVYSYNRSPYSSYRLNTSSAESHFQTINHLYLHPCCAWICMFTAILVIDSYTKEITLSNVDDYRFLPTEKIFFTGTVRNSGDYTIGEVSVEIKIVNKDTIAKQGGARYASNAFEELIGDAKVKPSYFVVTEVVATNLQPGQRKDFRIIMPHPSYFKGYTSYVRAYGQ